MKSSQSLPRVLRVVRQFSNHTEQFGYKKVLEGEKEGLVRGVFASVAGNYDVMNDLMSGGMHRLWKDDFVQKIGIQAMVAARRQTKSTEPLRFLDVAGGTGDISFRIIKALEKSGALDDAVSQETSQEGGLVRPGSVVTISDINPAMLEAGRKRAFDGRFSRQTLAHVGFREANAQTLPFEDNSFDVYTIAFGLRNVTDIDAALVEARRVLKPGGRFLCLEFSAIPKRFGPLRQIYDAYSFAAIPIIGQVVAGDRASYQYLVESIRLFPKQEELVAKLEGAGFKHASYTNYTAGVVAVHTGFKL